MLPVPFIGSLLAQVLIKRSLAGVPGLPTGYWKEKWLLCGPCIRFEERTKGGDGIFFIKQGMEGRASL